MRRSTRGVALLAVWMMVLADAFALSCGSSETAPLSDAGSGPSGDASVVDATISPDALSISAPGTTVYVAARATLSASAIGGPRDGTLAWTWAVLSAPAGSAITTASIVNESQANASFVPDVAGNYVLHVSATKGQASAIRDVKVVAVDAPVFYVTKNHNCQTDTTSYTYSDGGPRSVTSCVATGVQIMVSGASGGGAVPITAPYAPNPFDAGADADAASWDYGVGVIPEKMASQGSDWWEGPPGTESRLAFISAGRQGGPDNPTEPGGGQNIPATSFLSLATASANSSVQNNLVVGASETLFQPQFSPDGRRIAYVSDPATGTRLATVGFDGSDPHPELAVFFALNGAPAPKSRIGYYAAFGARFQLEQPVRPQWLDATHVAWLQDYSHNSHGGSPYGWQIMSVADVAGSPTPELYMLCNPLGVTRPDAGTGCNPIGNECSNSDDGTSVYPECCNKAQGGACFQSPYSSTGYCDVSPHVTDGGTLADGEWQAAGLPTQFAFLADGSVLVSVPARPGTGNLDSDRPYSSSLIILRPNPTTRACELVRVVKESRVYYTHQEVADGVLQSYIAYGDPAIARSSFVGDFALSPDRKQVAFLVHDNFLNPDPNPASRTARPSVFVAGIDPPSDPVSITQKNGLNGPRWIAGGALLATSTTEIADGGLLPMTSVLVVHPDGQSINRIAIADSGVVPLGIGNGFFDRGYYLHCATGPIGIATRSAPAIFFLAAIAAAVKRRRR